MVSHPFAGKREKDGVPGPLIHLLKLCPIHRSFIAMSGPRLAVRSARWNSFRPQGMVSA